MKGKKPEITSQVDELSLLVVANIVVVVIVVAVVVVLVCIETEI